MGRKVLQKVLSMWEEKCRSEAFSGQACCMWAKGGQRLANGSRFEETADNPTGNTEHWFKGSCGQRFSELFI